MDLMTFLTESVDPTEDQLSQRQLADTRRPRITFRHVNRLRKISELKRLEQAAHRQFVRTMYGKPADDAAGDMF